MRNDFTLLILIRLCSVAEPDLICDQLNVITIVGQLNLNNVLIRFNCF